MWLIISFILVALIFDSGGDKLDTSHSKGSVLHVTHAPVQESRSDWKAISPHDINCNIFKWKSDEGKVKYQPGHIKYLEL